MVQKLTSNYRYMCTKTWFQVISYFFLLCSFSLYSIYTSSSIFRFIYKPIKVNNPFPFLRRIHRIHGRASLERYQGTDIYLSTMILIDKEIKFSQNKRKKKGFWNPIRCIFPRLLCNFPPFSFPLFPFFPLTLNYSFFPQRTSPPLQP